MKRYDKIGDPSFTKEKCKKCKKTWTRYRSGSNDWKYKPCWNCVAEEVIQRIIRSY